MKSGFLVCDVIVGGGKLKIESTSSFYSWLRNNGLSRPGSILEGKNEERG
jgi:hypothetical protein